MEKVTIKNKSIATANRDGMAYLDRQQRPYSIVRIEVTDGRKMSAFAYQGDSVLGWRIGDSHDVDVSPSNDGKYLNFRVPKTQTQPPVLIKIQEKLQELENRIMALELNGDKPVEKMNDEINPADIPF